jgi:hypothetical protein
MLCFLSVLKAKSLLVFRSLMLMIAFQILPYVIMVSFSNALLLEYHRRTNNRYLSHRLR